MAVAEMRKVTIVGHQSLLDPVMSTLQRLDVLHIDDITDSLGTGDTLTATAPVDPASRAGIEEQTARVRSAISLLNEHFRTKTGLIETFAGVRFSVTESEYRQWAELDGPTEPLVSEAQELKEKLSRLQAEQNRALEDLEALRPWQALDVPPQEVVDTRLFRVQLGEISAIAAADFAAELEEISGAAGYVVISEDRDVLHIVAYYPRDKETELQGALRRAHWSPVELPPVDGTVTEKVAQLEEFLQQTASAQEETIEAVGDLVDERLALYAREDELQNQLDREEAKELLGYTQRLFVMRGWVRLRDLGTLQTALGELSPAIVLEAEEPGPDEEHPVDIENPKGIRPFEVVTRVGGLPRPGALDPTPFLAPFFFVFFGLSLGDAGYGIVLSLLSLWLVQRANTVGMGRQLMYLMAICGLGAVGAGILTGSWFGDLFGIPPLWCSPMDNPLPMLILSIGLGIVQIFAALGIKAYDNIRKGHVLDAFFDQGFWVVFLSGLILLLIGGRLPQLPNAGTVGGYVAIVGAAGLILTQGRHQANPIKRLFSGILSLYDVSGYMSDALSYSRLLALGMAGGVIGMVLNDIGRRLFAIPVVGWLMCIAVLVVGHLLNLLINLISAYVHASRLQYVEFFTKFLEAGGKPFRPLSERHRYLVVQPDAAPSSER